ncbi:MAG: 3-phosphoshikimate 1-carboxyvinyltransferase [Lachnospiraceae bacterium]|nr:3-phosphoshikimate 1-carboxyvinyltransferase [Lachnospiraceae bacterium]
MNITIKKSHLEGSLAAKPSKSYAHRYLIAAMLSDKSCTISNVDFSDDIKATLNSIKSYGKQYEANDIKKSVTFKQGSNINLNPIFSCNESGTTLRILLPIILTKYENATFIGSERLISRGISIYEEILSNIKFKKTSNSITTSGSLQPGIYNVRGNVSSQYISGLLYALPLLNGDSTINITTNLESVNYVLMTLLTLKNFGIDIETNIYTNLSAMKNFRICPDIYFNIKGNQKYVAHDFRIEGDYSNASFIDAFNYFNNLIFISGLNGSSLQSDKIYKEFFDKLNDDFCYIDISNCIDLGPILITFAALKNGGCFSGTERLQIKESNRGSAIATELKKCNANIDVFDNEIIVKKSDLINPNVAFDSHNDHRIVMSLTLLSTLFDIKINDYQCVKKSYPNFFDDLKLLGANIEYN